MKNLKYAKYAVASITLIILIAGCRTSPTPRFYLMRPNVNSISMASEGSAEKPVVGLLPVVLAKYLNRPQIALRKGDLEVAYAEFDRWAEPLEEQIAACLFDSLTKELKDFKVLSYPLRDAPTQATEISVSILNLDGNPGENVALSVKWQIITGKEDNCVTQEYSSNLDLKCSEPGMPGFVAATQQLLDKLSLEIAESVKAAKP